MPKRPYPRKTRKKKLIFEKGDEVGYPNIYATGGERKMTVVDRRIMKHAASRSMYTRYLCDGLLEQLAEDCRANTSNEFDNLICIDGREGSGKSNLAVALCHAIDPEWSLEQGYIYNYGEFVEAITGEDDDRGRVFLLDEGSLVANKRESMSEDSKRFIELLETMRSRGWTLVMCIPSVDRLDIYIREFRMRYRLTAVIDHWEYEYTEDQRGFFQLQQKWGDSYEQMYTVAYGLFPKMGPEDKEIYDRLKKQSQRRLMDKIAGKNKKETRTSQVMKDQSSRLSNACLKMQEMGMNRNEIANALGCSDEAVKEYLKRGRKGRNKNAEEEQTNQEE